MKTKFSRNLKRLRVQNRLTQQKTADFINVSQRAYGFYETGDRQPSIETLIKLAELFKVPLDILVGRYIEDNDDNQMVNQVAIGRNINQTIAR